LTDAGVKTLAVAVPLWRKVQAKFLSDMGRDAWAALRNELERLARMAVEMESQESRFPEEGNAAVKIETDW
jgi:hypothetical protein